MNTAVNFELAKLLKEKGFDEECRFYWSSDTNEIEEFQYYHSDRKYSDYTGYPEDVLYFIPTIADVIMWLYEKHGIWITTCVIGADGFGYWLHNKNRKRLNTEDQGGYWYSPTEAYEAAIEYTLNNLI